MSNKCLTPEQIASEVQRLKSLGGPSMYVGFHVSCGMYSTKADFGLSVYPDDIVHSETQKVFHGTFGEMIAAAEEFIRGYAGVREAEIVRRMALVIIDITDRLGRCSDFNLKAEKFSATEIADYHIRACEAASRMSGNAPFTVVMSTKAAAA